MIRMAFLGGAALLAATLFSGCAVGVGAYPNEDYGYYNEPAYYPYYGGYYDTGVYFHGGGGYHHGGSHGGGHGGHHH